MSKDAKLPDPNLRLNNITRQLSLRRAVSISADPPTTNRTNPIVTSFSSPNISDTPVFAHTFSGLDRSLAANNTDNSSFFSRTLSALKNRLSPAKVVPVSPTNDILDRATQSSSNSETLLKLPLDKKVSFHQKSTLPKANLTGDSRQNIFRQETVQLRPHSLNVDLHQNDINLDFDDNNFQEVVDRESLFLPSGVQSVELGLSTREVLGEQRTLARRNSDPTRFDRDSDTDSDPSDFKMSNLPLKFSGGYNDNAKLWENDYSLWASTQRNLSESAKVAHFMRLMSNQAKAWVSNLIFRPATDNDNDDGGSVDGNVFQSYDELREMFLTRFTQPVEFHSEVVSGLYDRKQKEDENIESYVNTMLQKGMLGNVSLDHIRYAVLNGILPRLKNVILLHPNDTLESIVRYGLMAERMSATENASIQSTLDRMEAALSKLNVSYIATETPLVERQTSDFSTGGGKRFHFMASEFLGKHKTT
jgi:hypothetical protein